ncbi:MAG: RNA-binding transcriptional accessory protein [Defluviitaleaceae bacterium]|nr:RNA-binding transcriptional accessory protein [Defluviitaleaceae bacterium]
MDIIAKLTQEFALQRWQVENTVTLIDEDNTIPFIARYRKEQTGSMDDQQLRELSERLIYLRNLEERKAAIIASLTEHGHLTEELAASVAGAVTLQAVEDIYRPYKPKRRTRATIAIEKGLQPLADIIWEQDATTGLEEIAAPFVDAEKGVETVADALQGAMDILAEKISDDPACRTLVRQLTFDSGIIASELSKKGKENPEDNAAAVYEMYFEFSEPIKKIAGHRTLAINRGEKEGFLKVDIAAPEERILEELHKLFIKRNDFTQRLMEDTLADSYKRLTAPAVEREMRNLLTEQAEEGAIKVFGQNLRQLLMQAPIKENIVLAIDPGFRTGCKLAVVDETGKVLETGVVYCTTTKDTGPSKKMLAQMINRHKVTVIAIGNGTASRETEVVVAELLKETGIKAQYVIVNEAGASVYSASKLGADEFPDFDVALRSAVSIGRRLQDPLAELVKIDPKSIGIGQYQHDMNQKNLSETLSGVVESCVNSVGVDLNTASPSLLSYVAGVSPAVAKNILTYREENGKFTDRKQLLKVAKLGPKAYEQCAGFLRVPGGKNPLDNTAVHPESYAIAQAYLQYTPPAPAKVTKSLKDLSATPKVDYNTMAKDLGVGVPTLKDIVKELEKPGRDPRDELPPVLLRSDVLEMEDLEEGMILTGTVRNVIDFGAFVDIGVHQDGLVHISQIAKRRINHPLDAVQLGDVVKVKVLSVDLKKKRIALSMKDAN